MFATPSRSALCLAAIGPWTFLGAHASQPDPISVAPASLRAAKPLFDQAVAAHLLGASGGSPHGHPSATKDYPQYPGFSLWLVEEFDEPLDLDQDPVWTWSDGGLGEGQVRFTKENLVFEGGTLKIMVLDNGKAAQPQPQSCSHAESGPVGEKPLTSGELRTRHNMFRYGIYETRMRAPSVQLGDTAIDGNYVATMFAYRDAKFRHWREIDIEVTGDTARSVTMNVLHAENTEGWSPAIQSSKTFEAPEDESVRADFHNFAFTWLPTGITWYFDGEVVGFHGHDDKLPVPEMSTKIMMNLWIFLSQGWGFGGPDGWNNRYPMHSEYDWLRFYKWDGDSQYPCVDGTDSCLTDDDKYLSSNNPCDGIQQEGLRNGGSVCTATCPYAKHAGEAAKAEGATEPPAQSSILFP